MASRSVRRVTAAEGGRPMAQAEQLPDPRGFMSAAMVAAPQQTPVTETASYSITLSARMPTGGGMVRPISRAVRSLDMLRRHATDLVEARAVECRSTSCTPNCRAASRPSRAASLATVLPGL